MSEGQVSEVRRKKSVAAGLAPAAAGLAPAFENLAPAFERIAPAPYPANRLYSFTILRREAGSVTNQPFALLTSLTSAE